MEYSYIAFVFSCLLWDTLSRVSSGLPVLDLGAVGGVYCSAPNQAGLSPCRSRELPQDPAGLSHFVRRV